MLLTLGPTSQALATYELEITSTPLKLADPGELVTHVFTVHNQGTSPDTYKLSLDLPEGWSSLPIPEQISLAAGETRPVFVNVSVPRGARAGAYDIELTAQSKEDPPLEKTATTQIQVRSVPGFDLSWVDEPTPIAPGIRVDGTFRIVNRGNLPDSYEIEVSVPAGWSYSLDEDTVRLIPGESVELRISFIVPEDARPGERYRIDIKATSRHDRGLVKTITSRDTLGPLPPERVPITLFPYWDTTTRVRVDQDGEPSFRFRGRGDIPNLGDVSASLSLTAEGFQGGRLRLRRDHWGVVINGASISGSYEGISGSPLFRYRYEDLTARFLYTEQSKGISLRRDGDNLDLRAVLGADTSEEGLFFQELEGSFEFTNGPQLEGFITTAETQTRSGTILGASLQLSDEKIDLRPSFVRVYPGYPDQTPRWETGVNLTYDEEEFTSSFDWDYDRTRLGEEPEIYFSREHNFGFTTSLDLGEDLSSSVSLGLRRRKTDDEPTSNHLRVTSVSGGLSGGDDLNWSLGTGFSHRKDVVEDVTTSTHNVDGSLGFSIGESDHSLSLSLTQRYGPFGQSLNQTFTFSSEFPEIPLSPRFSLSSGNEDTVFSADLSDDEPRDYSLDISFSASLVQQDSVSFSLSLSFPDPFRFVGPTKGQVRGYLYIVDRDKEGIEGALLSLEDETAITGEGGRFVFPPVEPGRYELEIQQLQAGLTPTINLPMTVEVEAGKQHEVEIPVRPRSWIRGTVFHDRDQDGIRDPDEAGMSGIEIQISGEGIERRVRSGPTGRFTVDLPPGSFRLKLLEESLPERHEPTTPTTVTVETEEYGRTDVEFGVYEKPRPVEVTFGPPTASFSYTPEDPNVGEEILLDASESSAIRAEIDTYEWRLTHDGEVIEGEGQRVRATLWEAGLWEVALTVTDENGLQGREVKEIRVAEN